MNFLVALTCILFFASFLLVGSIGLNQETFGCRCACFLDEQFLLCNRVGMKLERESGNPIYQSSSYRAQGSY
jgi:hypothetical protein